MAARLYRAMGFMTGTSMDGLDAALMVTDGQTRIDPGPARGRVFDAPLRALIEAAVADARDWRFSGPEPASFATAERALTEAHAEAARMLAEDANLSLSEIDVIGFHGQTVLHEPPDDGRPGRTRQLGDGAALARALGVPVVNDFRAADMRAGGQGAPLAPLYHAALAQRDRLERPLAVYNLGGVANVTLIAPDGGLTAFDTGPANGPIDDWVRARKGADFDADGRFALSGRLDAARLESALSHPYFAVPPPKSLDRSDFTADIAKGLSLEDGARLLTEISAASAIKALDWAKTPPRQIVLAGGGRRNPVLVQAMRARAPAPVLLAEDVGWRGDDLEAELFAWLAVRSLRGLPLTEPGTTGVREPVTGGVLNPP